MLDEDMACHRCWCCLVEYIAGLLVVSIYRCDICRCGADAALQYAVHVVQVQVSVSVTVREHEDVVSCDVDIVVGGLNDILVNLLAYYHPCYCRAWVDIVYAHIVLMPVERHEQYSRCVFCREHTADVSVSVDRDIEAHAFARLDVVAPCRHT